MLEATSEQRKAATYNENINIKSAIFAQKEKCQMVVPFEAIAVEKIDEDGKTKM